MKKVLFLFCVTLFSSAALAQTTCEEWIEWNVKFFSDTCALGASGCSTGSQYNTYSVESAANVYGAPYAVLHCKLRQCHNDEVIYDQTYNVGSCGVPPLGGKPIPDTPNPTPMCGSVVHAESRIVGETVPLVGAGFSLNYFSNWVTGRGADYKLRVPLAGSTPRDNITSFGVLLKSGLTTITSTSYTNNQADLNFDYTWNGLDASSNPTLGSKKFQVTITEVRPTISIPIPSEVNLGSFKAKLIGIGAWLPSIYGYYDANSKTLYRGDGSLRKVEAVTTSTGFMIADESGSLVYEFDSDGKIETIKTGLIGTTLYTFNYNMAGHLSSIDEPFGRTTTFNRNLSGVLTSITAPKGQVTTISLDGNGYISQITNPQSESYQMTYVNSGGLLETFTKPEGNVSTFTYDSEGGLTKDEKSSGYFFDLIANAGTGYSSDVSQQTRMSRVTRVQSQIWEGAGTTKVTHPNSLEDNSSNSTSGIYTTESRFSKGVYFDDYYNNDARFGAMTKFANQNTVNYGPVSYYTSHTQSVTLSDPADPFSITAYSVSSQKGTGTVTTSFDPSTKIFSSATGLGRTNEYEIDTYERVSSSTRGNLYPLEFTYTNENLTKIKQSSRETNLTYNGAGFVDTIVNPLSQTTGFVYDSAGRLYSKILPDLRTTTFAYDSNGNLTGITPPGRTIHSFVLNDDENATSYDPPTLSGVSVVNTTYSYNNDKQLTQIQRPVGTIDYTYNSTTGVLESITDGTTTNTITTNYSNALPSNMALSGSFQTSFSYAGTVPTAHSTYDSSSVFVGGFSVALSSNGTIGSDTVTDVAGTSMISYTYDDDELLTGAGDLTLTNDTPNGMLTDTAIGTSPNIVTDSYTYNSFGEVTAYQAKYGSTVIYDLTLGRDGMGRINSKTQVMNSTTDAYSYTFDTTGRLTQTNKNSTTVATYGYDDNSNRNSGTIGLQPTTATYDAQDRMTAYNLLTFTYNANGDLTSRTDTMTSTTTNYTYDVFGNLTSVTLPNADVIDYEIDGLNRRIGKKLNGVLQKRWVYMDQTRIAAELDSSGNIDKRFVYASKSNIPDYMIMGGDNYRIISDHLGSPRLVVKVSDGTIAGRMDHDEYGRVTVNTSPGLLPFGFAGGLYDADTGLVRFGARDYDSETGRWTSKDPILFQGGDTNLFGYTWNDPVNFIDPEGLAGRSTPYLLTPNDEDNSSARPPICVRIEQCRAISDWLKYPAKIPGGIGGGAGWAIKGFQWGFDKATRPNARERETCGFEE